jgi:hypothetical protein
MHFALSHSPRRGLAWRQDAKQNPAGQLKMADKSDKAPQQQKRHWILVPMREQPFLVFLLHLLPLAIALLLVALLGR